MTDNEMGAGASATPEKIAAWFRGRLPEGWTAHEVVVDRDEITVVVDLSTVSVTSGQAADGTDSTDSADMAAAQTPEDEAAEELAGRVSRFREDTRAVRVTIAREAERRYERKVAWGVSDGSTTQLFTTIAVPVMTRLRQPERKVLDTLVEAGVARSRAHALAWCVDLVGRHSADWLDELREAMTQVERVRSAGPDSTTS